MVNRREFLTKSVGLAGILFASDSKAQPARNLVGKLNDSLKEYGIIERFSDGIYLNQTVIMTKDYTAEILYFVRNGANREFSEWSVKCDLYMKNNPQPVNSMRVDGTAETGKFAVTKTEGPDKRNLIESVFTDGAYEQSTVFFLTKRDEAYIKEYLAHLIYQIKYQPNLPQGSLKPMPPGYNPLN